MKRSEARNVNVAVVTQFIRFLDEQDIVIPEAERYQGQLDWQHQLWEVFAIRRCASAARQVVEIDDPVADQVHRHLSAINWICCDWLNEEQRLLGQGEAVLNDQLTRLRNVFLEKLMNSATALAEVMGVKPPMYSPVGCAKRQKTVDRLDAEDIVNQIQPRRSDGELGAL